MKHDRIHGMPFYDLSFVRNLWEVRVKRYRQRQRKEQERIEKSALARVNQQWQYRIVCRSMKSSEISELQHYLQRSDGISHQVHEQESSQAPDIEEKRYIFELTGETWKELPSYIRHMTDLREWHIRETCIHKIPAYIEEFQHLTVLNIPRNGIEELPVELGKLAKLTELNVSYNKLSNIPPEVGECKHLEKLEMTANFDLKELPFELSSLKKLIYLDISGNKFCSVPVCVLRMSSLQWLDLSNNLLTDLPEDFDRLQELTSVFLHKNKLTYLPMSLANISCLSMLVVSGEHLVSFPSRLSEEPTIKFISLFDNAVDSNKVEKEDETKQKKRLKDEKESDKEFMQAYIETLKERETAPKYTTKVSLSCLL